MIATESTAVAVEVYLTSFVVMNPDQAAGLYCLDRRATALKLDRELVEQLETEAKKV